MRLLCLLAALAAVGCGADDPPADYRDPCLPAQQQDERLVALGIVCETTLALDGTFTPTTPAPDDSDDCWGAGIWEVELAIDVQGCVPQRDIPSRFRYEVVRDGAEIEIIWLDNPGDPRANLALASDNGQCAGRFEHFVAESSLSVVCDDTFPGSVVISLQPTLEANDTIGGRGTWSLYERDPL